MGFFMRGGLDPFSGVQFPARAPFFQTKQANRARCRKAVRQLAVHVNPADVLASGCLLHRKDSEGAKGATAEGAGNAFFKSLRFSAFSAVESLRRRWRFSGLLWGGCGFAPSRRGKSFSNGIAPNSNLVPRPLALAPFTF